MGKRSRVAIGPSAILAKESMDISNSSDEKDKEVIGATK
jgi:hypothetical protein